MAKIPNRASPLPPEERKAAIIEAVIPAMIEHGAALTSRQIAEAAGVAEGTIFRVFGDKETLLREASEVYLDPAPVRALLGGIDAALALEDKVEKILAVLRDRFHGVISIMSALGYTGSERPNLRDRSQDGVGYVSIVAKALEPELERLNVPPEDVVPYMRLVAFATAIPVFNRTVPFDDGELVRLIVYGIAGDTRMGEEDAARKRAALRLAAGRAGRLGPAAPSDRIERARPQSDETTEVEAVESATTENEGATAHV